MSEPEHVESTSTDTSVVAQVLALGGTLAGTVISGVVLGVLVDHLANSAPIGLFGGLLLGSVGAVFSVVTLMRRWK